MATPLNLPWDRYEMRQDADGRADGQAVYQGFSSPGMGTNKSTWTIYKYTYSGSFITLRQVVFKKDWDNRSTHF